jgi:16S rRNA (uracil1498-N3)-methyltransferase
MRKPRVYVDTGLDAGAKVELPATASHHVFRVLRMRVGDEITLFNGLSDEEFTAEITLAERNQNRVQIHHSKPVDTESPLNLSLVQAISAGDKMDFTIQKAVELGVKEITPIYSSRSAPIFKPERLTKRLAHWQQVIISATEQSGRTRLTKLAMPQNFRVLLENQVTPESCFMLDPRSETAFSSRTVCDDYVQLWVGPEGGFSADEIALASATGVKPVSFGRRILRTETAGIAAAALLQAKFGDL